MNHTNNEISDELRILHEYPFAPVFVVMPNYMIDGLELRSSSSDDLGDSGLEPWLEAKFKEADIDESECFYTDNQCDNGEIYISAAAGLKIAATFDNKLGDYARIYLDNLADTNRHDYCGALTPVRVLLEKLQRHQRELHRVMEDDAKWHNMAQVRKLCSSTPDNTPDKLRTPNEAINAAYSKDVCDRTGDILLCAGTRRFNKVREIVAKMEALYASPLYAAAVALDIAPKLQD